MIKFLLQSSSAKSLNAHAPQPCYPITLFRVIIASSVVFSILLTGCSKTQRAVGTEQTAEGTISKSVILRSPIDVINRLDGHKVVSLTELSADGGSDGLTLTLPASIVNPSLNLSPSESMEITIPRSAVASERVNVNVLARLIVTDSMVIDSPINIGNRGGGTSTELAGKLVAFVSGTTADGEAVGGVVMPQRYAYETQSEAARAAGVGGIVAKADVADTTSGDPRVAGRYLAIPRKRQ